ncbi:MAG: transporter substrate-binding domain-containing protein [Burkholderiales bacterium]|nr:MAG: transporter substrate-binding domain-containing protein [Burkholderiales bacterium]
MRWGLGRAWKGIVLTAGALAASAAAAEPACGPHVAALYPYAPFFRELPDGGSEGIDKDMFDELARRSGCELRLVVESRVRIWEQMRGGAAALTLSAVPTAERQTFAEFVPYAQGRYHLMLRPDVARRVRSLAAFEADPSLTLLTVKGYAHGPTLDAATQRLRARGRLHEVADFPAVLRMASAGRAHGLLALPSAWSQVESAVGEQRAWVALDVAPQDRALGALALSLQMPAADRQRLRRALNGMLADGTVMTIMRRHLGDAAARAAAYPEPTP